MSGGNRLQLLCLFVLILCTCMEGACKAPLPGRLANRLFKVQFPGPWLSADGQSVITSPSQYEFRENKTHALLIARKALSLRSRNAYSIHVDNDVRVVGVSDNNWNEGVALNISDTKLLDHASSSERLTFQGHTYTRSGGHWGAAFPSPDGRWLALLSYSAKESKSQNNPLPYIGGGEPAIGTLIFDFYDTKTGAKVAGTRVSYSGFGPSLVLEQGVWIGSSRFLVPVDILAQKALLFDPS